MKKIMKLFPAALAMLALASCSTDDLQLAENKEINFDPTRLYVQVEGDEVTRSGYINSQEVQPGAMYRVTAFTQGDKVKVYHNTSNWRPQYWEYTETIGQYDNTNGIDVFDKSGDDTSEADQYDEAYGVYPSDLATFANENRTAIDFDLSVLKKIDYVKSAQTLKYQGVDKAGTFIKLPIPMWGYRASGEQIMRVKNLTGILRLDINRIEAATGANMTKYLVVKSDKKLNGKFATTPIADPSQLMNVQPALVTEASTVTWTSGNDLRVIKEGANDIADNVIIIDLKQQGGHLMAFAPITAGKQNFEIYLTDAILNTTAEVPAANVHLLGTLTSDDIAAINAEKNWSTTDEVQRGRLYQYNDDNANINTTAKTPFEMVKAIIAADKEAYRDFSITFQEPIEVKNEDTAPQNHIVDFSGETPNYGLEGEFKNYSLKHNVTVKATFISKKVANPAKLRIIKVTGGKTLTLKWKNGAVALDSVIVESTDLDGKLVFSRDADVYMPAIRNMSDNQLTLKNAGSQFVKTYGRMTINNDYAAIPDRITNLQLCGNATQIDLLGGDIKKISLSRSFTGDALSHDVLIKSEGKSVIDEIDYTNMIRVKGSDNKYSDQFNLVFESKWTGGASGTPNTPTVITGVATDPGLVFATAYALNSYNGSVNAKVLGTMDLNGAEQTWTSKALTASFEGVEFFRTEGAATAGTAAAAPKGSATIKNIKGENGLFASFTPVAAGNFVKNLNISGSEIKRIPAGAADTDGAALLIGNVNLTNGAATITNINVSGTNNVEVTKQSQYVGAVIGKITADAGNAVNIAGVNVATGTTIKGFGRIGGIVGGIQATATGAVVNFGGLKDGAYDIAWADRSNLTYNSSAATLTIVPVPSVTNSELYSAYGQFVGGTDAATGKWPAVNVYLATAPTAPSADWTATSTRIGQWVKFVLPNLITYPVTLYTNLFGMSGIHNTGDATNTPTIGLGETVFTLNLPGATAWSATAYKAFAGLETAKPANITFANWVNTAE